MRCGKVSGDQPQLPKEMFAYSSGTGNASSNSPTMAKAPHSKPALRLIRDRPADHPDVIAQAPLLYALAFVAALLVHWLWPMSILPPIVASLIGLAVLLPGGLLAIWGKRTMESSGTNVSPALPATGLVVTGPFRFSRNPLYLARTLLYAGLAFMMNTPWPFVSLVPLLAVVRYGVIRPEEDYLFEKFGAEYESYRRRVRRWL
jgi:protein-S-isoprenylcysteine O-methyltransferase Ste14